MTWVTDALAQGVLQVYNVGPAGLLVSSHAHKCCLQTLEAPQVLCTVCGSAGVVSLLPLCGSVRCCHVDYRAADTVIDTCSLFSTAGPSTCSTGTALRHLCGAVDAVRPCEVRTRAVGHKTILIVCIAACPVSLDGIELPVGDCALHLLNAVC